MIIKIHKAGRSFKGVCRYLTHDTGRKDSAERVAWTKTLNLANDDVDCAVDEMLWTFRAADMLKRQAGVPTGGSKLDKPVRHLSLSWPQGEAPTRAHMAETVQAYLKFMGWDDRQAVMVAHHDTQHAHIHVVINSVSPADGRALKNSHDWRRSEDFALRYEREHGQIHCEQRLKNKKQRDKTPTREAWQRFKPSEKTFDRDEAKRLLSQPGYFERKDARTMNGREWGALKAFQKHQREQFFIGGKAVYRAVRNQAFREIREEFRGQWNAYYAAKRQGHDRAALAAMKLALVEAQNRALEKRRDTASDELREQRDREYQAILAQQQVDRDELGLRQGQGLRTYAIMDVIYPVPEAPPPREQPKKEERRWKAGPEAEPRRAVDGVFRRAGAATVDPVQRRDDLQAQPGVVRREEKRKEFTPTATRAKEAPPAIVREKTETTVEKERVTKAREMHDGQAEKDQREQATALRASWNRHRGSGSRGRRD